MDGSLRDIYVFDTTLADWERLINFIRDKFPIISFTLDSVQAKMPANASEIFAFRASQNPSCNFMVNGISVAFHFFCEEEIEMDIVPNDIDRPERLAILLNFIAGLGDCLNKPVVLTPE